MKKKLTATLLILATVPVIGAVMLNQPATPEVKSVKETSVSKPTPSPEPTETPIVEQPTQPAQPVQKAPEQPKPKTLDDLIVEYNWDTNPYLAQWMRRWPQRFTESEMESSFKYMHDVGLAYAKKTGKTDISPSTENAVANAGWNLLYNWNGLGESGGTPEKDNARWVFMGKYTGVDTSRYE